MLTTKSVASANKKAQCHAEVVKAAALNAAAFVGDQGRAAKQQVAKTYAKAKPVAVAKSKVAAEQASLAAKGAVAYVGGFFRTLIGK